MTFDAEATTILHEGRQAYMATSTSKAPTVTPVLYTPLRDGIAFMTAATTRKATRLRKGQPVGVVVRCGGRAVVFTGHAEVVDPLRPMDAARRLPELARAVGGFALRNSADLFGFAHDAARGRLPLRAFQRRVAVLVRAWDAMVVDVPAGGEDAVVAWSTDDGPRAAAGTWHADRQRAAIAWVPGMPERAPASVVTDDYGRPGPAAKRGVMLLGDGCFEPDGDMVWVGIAPKKMAAWTGTETETGTVP